MGSLERRCAGSARCVHRERRPAAGRDQWVGALLTTAEGLCGGCTTRTVRSIQGLPQDVIELTVLIGATGSAGLLDVAVARSRELPVPIRLGVEALRSDIDSEVHYWATVIGWSDPVQRQLPVRVHRAASFLADRVDTLLQLGPHERAAWTRDGEQLCDFRGGREAIALTGLEGALRLVELHQRVRRVAGRTKLVHRLTPACPWCDQRALVRHNGSDIVECESCGKQIEERHYDWFVRTLARPEAAA